VVELVVMAGLAFAALVVVGVLISAFSIVGWFLWLPFRVLGWALKFVGLVIALPFIVSACLLGGFGMLLGAGVLFRPLLPLIAFVAVLWWLVRPRGPRPSQERVVS